MPWRNPESQENSRRYGARITADGSAAGRAVSECARGSHTAAIAWTNSCSTAFFFTRAASLVLDYLFDVVELRRLEARVIIDNGRAAAALMKLGARPEGILQQAFGRDDTYVDAVLWTILRDQWRASRTTDSSAPTPPSFAA